MLGRRTCVAVGSVLTALAALLPGCREEASVSGINLTDAVVVARSGDLSNAERVAPVVLVEEVARRSGVTWRQAETVPAGSPMILLNVSTDSGLATEGFRIETQVGSRRPEITITGADGRGVLYGVGYLLRKIACSPGRVSLPRPVAVTTSPRYAIRGYQMGYRPTANSWDMWERDDFDQYFRELALFGANAIEGIPFGGELPFQHMTRRQASIEMSRICDRYGMDYWLRLLATDDLAIEEDRAATLAAYDSVFAETPRVDGVFVPGGDSGDNHPSLLLPFVRDLDVILKRHHPNAGIWVSLQKFAPSWEDYFFEYVNEHQPTWLAGVIDGPWGPEVHSIRRRLPEQYPIRAYPDISHNVRCQFPVPWWDPAFARTLGREGPNMRPVHYALIHERTAPPTVGSVAYSDGIHDDLNRAVWSLRAWDPGLDVREIVVDYTRLFFGAQVAEEAADGILALERNWTGPLAQNGGVDATLALWQRLEREHPELSGNWRWQLCVLRAYYDAYARHRLIHESALQEEACAVLAGAAERGAEAVIAEALAVLARAETAPVRQDLRTRIFELCEALYQSIRLQTSVERYGAAGPERGAVLDFVDVPLNERWWLEDEFLRVRGMASEEEKVARLDVLRTWEHPGQGSFYDDVGNVAKSPHVLRGESVVTDPALERTPFPFFMWWDDGRSRARWSWQSDVHWPTLVYREIDRNAAYTVRVTGRGPLFMRINGTPVQQTSGGTEMGEFRYYPVPREAVRYGVITLTWDDPDAGNVRWREWSRVNEVWLLRD